MTESSIFAITVSCYTNEPALISLPQNASVWGSCLGPLCRVIPNLFRDLFCGLGGDAGLLTDNVFSSAFSGFLFLSVQRFFGARCQNKFRCMRDAESLTKNQEPGRVASEQRSGLLGGGGGPLTDNVVFTATSGFLFLSVQRFFDSRFACQHSGTTCFTWILLDFTVFSNHLTDFFNEVWNFPSTLFEDQVPGNKCAPL